MGTLNEDLTAIKEVEDTIIANKVANFAYTDEAYKKNLANGVIKYNVNNAQNIPTADPSVLKVNNTVLSQGYRAQASSITRMLMNHFLGRLSYNVNKVNDGFSNLVATLIKHRGTANGFATLDENGRVPYSQLPESAVGDVKTVNNISPENGNIPLTGENIPVSSTDPTLLSAPLTTDRYANSSVTTEKIADNAVTNAKIKEPISVDKGGTGKTTAVDACNELINALDLEADTPKDGDFYISQFAGGSELPDTNINKKTYVRRPLSALWEYIKTKISSVLGLTDTQYNGNAETATQATQDGNGKNIANTYATKTETEKVKWLKSVRNSSSNTKYYVVKNIKNDPLQIMGSITRVDTICSVFNFTVTNHNKEQTRIVGVWNNSAMHDQTWEILPFRLYYQSDGSCNLWVEIPSYSSMMIVLSSYNATDYNFQESAFDDTGILCSNEMSITATNATDAYNAYRGMVHTCSTDAGTASKTVSIPGFTLTQGACIRVLFTNGNSVAYPTLNVNGTGAKEIYGPRGALDTLIESASDISVKKGSGICSWKVLTVLDLYYDEEYGRDCWQVIGDPIVKTFYTDTSSLHKNVTMIGNVQESILY